MSDLSIQALRHRIDQARNSLCGLVRTRTRLEHELLVLDDEDESDHERILQIRSIIRKRNRIVRELRALDDRDATNHERIHALTTELLQLLQLVAALEAL